MVRARKRPLFFCLPPPCYIVCMRFNEFIGKHFPGLENPEPVPQKDPRQERIEGLLARYAGIQEQRKNLEVWMGDRGSRVPEDNVRLKELERLSASVAEELQGLGVTPPGEGV